MNKKNFMTLDFFANRLGVHVKSLTWAMIKVDNFEGAQLFPVIKIKDKERYFDIMEDELFDKNISSFGRKISFFPAEMQENETEFIFTSSQGVVKITKERLLHFYRSKTFI